VTSIIAGDRTLIDRIAVNRRRAVLVTVGTALLVGVVVGLLSLLVVAPAVALAVLVVVTAALASIAWWGCERLVARLIPIDPADPVAHARLFNLVAGLCINAGVPPPSLGVVNADGLNALVAGRNPRNATLVVTQGLLDRLSLIELEAVLARELSQIKSYDVLPATVAVALFGIFRVLTPLSVIAGPGLRLSVGSQREEVADLAAVSLTRFPPAMLAALEKMQSLGTAVPNAPPAVAHLWLADPIPPGQAAGATRAGHLFGTHPPLEERIEALREL
jgi:heat shock protein HtpX